MIYQDNSDLTFDKIEEIIQCAESNFRGKYWTHLDNHTQQYLEVSTKDLPDLILKEKSYMFENLSFTGSIFSSALFLKAIELKIDTIDLPENWIYRFRLGFFMKGANLSLEDDDVCSIYKLNKKLYFSFSPSGLSEMKFDAELRMSILHRLKNELQLPLNISYENNKCNFSHTQGGVVKPLGGMLNPDPIGFEIELGDASSTDLSMMFASIIQNFSSGKNMDFNWSVSLPLKYTPNKQDIEKVLFRILSSQMPADEYELCIDFSVGNINEIIDISVAFPQSKLSFLLFQIEYNQERINVELSIDSNLALKFESSANIEVSDLNSMLSANFKIL